MASETVCFVSGASRGIGFALVKELATRYPNAVVYAGVRDPANSTALQTLAASLPQGKVHIVNWTAANEQVNRAVGELILEKHGHVDIVVANAAVSKSDHVFASQTPIDDFKEMLEVNATGVLMLFQFLYPLLKASKHPAGAKFVTISSEAGSVDGPWISAKGLTGYGASKAAMNYVCRKIHFENEWLTCFPIAPGVVATDMLENYVVTNPDSEMAKNVRLIAKTPEDTARMLVDLIDAAKRETHSGEFFTYNGDRAAW
ncbi:hypothetical protein D9619_004918 [Psilocybe cf. subviscida]|uniref:Uncharacterized protein n=1 Tax=Psilocybe cf. subviscida TaxID=2480587 RepID=A0A8H5BQ90_9AGAR|nr:hypothetical protein D9619_004918 [Psilocybe cf. subviscida]